MVLDVLPPGDPALDPGRVGIERRALGVVHVPADVDDAPVLVDLGGDRGVRHLRRADVTTVQVGLVGQVEQVVDQQAVARVQRGHPAHHRVPGVGKPRGTGNRGRIGPVPVADPDPDEGVLLHHRIGGDPRGARNALLTGYEDTRAGRVVGEAVVAADDRVAVEPALGQRVAPVYAPVGERHRLPRPGAVEHQWLTEHRTGEQTPADLTAVGRHVPLVPGEHHPTDLLLDVRRCHCIIARGTR